MPRVRQSLLVFSIFARPIRRATPALDVSVSQAGRGPDIHTEWR
jgi:hypothetical protein